MFAVRSLSIPAFVFLCVILIAGLAYGSYQLGKQLMKLYFYFRDKLRRY